MDRTEYERSLEKSARFFKFGPIVGKKCASKCDDSLRGDGALKYLCEKTLLPNLDRRAHGHQVKESRYGAAHVALLGPSGLHQKEIS